MKNSTCRTIPNYGTNGTEQLNKKLLSRYIRSEELISHARFFCMFHQASLEKSTLNPLPAKSTRLKLANASTRVMHDTLYTTEE